MTTTADFGFKADFGFEEEAGNDFGFEPLAEATSSTQAVVPRPREDTQIHAAPGVLQLEQQRLADVQARSMQAAQEREQTVFTPSEQARLNSEDVSQVLMHPPPGFEAPQVSREQVLKRFPTMTEGDAGILAGVLQTAAGAWNFMASPAGVAMAGAAAMGGPVGAAALGTFALDALKQVPKAHDALSQAFADQDPEKVSKAASELALQMSVLFGGAKGARETLATAKRVEPAAEAGTAPNVVEASTTARADTSLGIAPPGTGFVQRAIEYFTPPRPSATPAIRVEHGARVPRFQPYETEKALAVSPEGMAKVPVLGALIDPRATAKTGTDVAIITRAHSLHKGRTLASMWAESQFRNRELFKAGEDGTIPLTSGQRGYISDVIEAELRDPGSQAITAKQRAWINEEWKPLREDVNRMLEEEGVREVHTEDMDYAPSEDYFPRVTIGKRNRDVTATSSSAGRPGAAPFFEKSRKFETEFEGARAPREGERKEQIIYDPDAISRATKFMAGAYRSVADHRLANDAALGGQSIKERYDDLLTRNEDRLSLLDEEARVDADIQLREQAAYPVWGKEERLHIAPAFANKIYPVESAQKLRGAYADEVRGWVKGAQTITGATKAMMATADMSAPLVQGAAMMGRHPVLWAKATLNSYKSLLDQNVTAKLLEQPEYKAAAESFTQAGGSLLRLNDFLAGMEKGEVATKIPGVGRVLEATGRAYGTFLDLAKLELWKAWEPVTSARDLGTLAESIETALFTGRMESIGLNPHRAVGERLMMFAPMYYRGAGNLLSSAFQRGVSGNMARQMIGGYATAGLLTTMGGWLAAGLSEEEIEKRLDPRRGLFLKVPVPTGDGGQIEVGVGNVLTQLLRLSGQAAAYHIEDKPIDTGVEGNPYLRFLRGRAAFIPSLGIEIATGTDYLGNPITIKEATARRFMPFVLQSLMPREETKPAARAMDAAFSFFGLNAFPESEYATQLRQMDNAAREKHGAPIFELPLAERAKAVKEFQASDAFKKRDPTMQDMRRFLKLNEERRDALSQRLKPETQAALEKLGLSPGTYKSTLTLGGIDVPLSRKEQERYQDLLVAEFDAQVEKLPAEVNNATQAIRDKWWEKYASAIRAKARTQLMREIAQPR